MTISPIQQMRHDYVTKKEFGDFKKDTNIRFDNVEHSIKELKVLTLEGFDKMEEYIDNNNKEITQKITNHIDHVKIDIINQIKSSKK